MLRAHCQTKPIAKAQWLSQLRVSQFSAHQIAKVIKKWMRESREVMLRTAGEVRRQAHIEQLSPRHIARIDGQPEAD
jgi:hypothetical protein